ncbi:hypothetical protein MNV49_000083 [Pseudohyphozyma bogoriensis]|nr:hypothetical protein MNV49_000083 [Pseudohyphozyma bogoriensis]
MTITSPLVVSEGDKVARSATDLMREMGRYPNNTVDRDGRVWSGKEIVSRDMLVYAFAQAGADGLQGAICDWTGYSSLVETTESSPKLFANEVWASWRNATTRTETFDIPADPEFVSRMKTFLTSGYTESDRFKEEETTYFQSLLSLLCNRLHVSFEYFSTTVTSAPRARNLEDRDCVLILALLNLHLRSLVVFDLVKSNLLVSTSLEDMFKKRPSTKYASGVNWKNPLFLKAFHSVVKNLNLSAIDLAALGHIEVVGKGQSKVTEWKRIWVLVWERYVREIGFPVTMRKFFPELKKAQFDRDYRFNDLGAQHVRFLSAEAEFIIRYLQERPGTWNGGALAVALASHEPRVSPKGHTRSAGAIYAWLNAFQEFAVAKLETGGFDPTKVFQDLSKVNRENVAKIRKVIEGGVGDDGPRASTKVSKKAVSAGTKQASETVAGPKGIQERGKGRKKPDVQPTNVNPLAPASSHLTSSDANSSDADSSDTNSSDSGSSAENNDNESDTINAQTFGDETDAGEYGGGEAEGEEDVAVGVDDGKNEEEDRRARENPEKRAPTGRLAELVAKRRRLAGLEGVPRYSGALESDGDGDGREDADEENLDGLADLDDQEEADEHQDLVGFAVDDEEELDFESEEESNDELARAERRLSRRAIKGKGKERSAQKKNGQGKEPEKSRKGKMRGGVKK